MQEPHPRLLVIVGSTRPGRFGSAIARWLADVAVAHGGFDVELVELEQVGLPLLDEPGNPISGEPYEHEHTRAWSATVRDGDAFVFVTPEYNNGYPAAVKNAIDYLYHEWADKAVGFVSYGGNVGAGTRALQALKHVMLAVRAFPVHEAVNIPFVHSTMNPAQGFAPAPVLERAARGMLDELLRRERALRGLRRPAPVPATAGASSNGRAASD